MQSIYVNVGVHLVIENENEKRFFTLSSRLTQNYEDNKEQIVHHSFTINIIQIILYNWTQFAVKIGFKKRKPNDCNSKKSTACLDTIAIQYTKLLCYKLNRDLVNDFGRK